MFRLAEAKLNFQDNFLLYTEFRENKRLLVFFLLRLTGVTQRRLRLGLEKKHREEKEISRDIFFSDNEISLLFELRSLNQTLYIPYFPTHLSNKKVRRLKFSACKIFLNTKSFSMKQFSVETREIYR